MSEKIIINVFRRKRKCKFFTKGSVTAEASLVFPLFFFAVLALCYLFVFLETQYTIQKAMLYTARNLSAYGEVVNLVDEKKAELLKAPGISVLNAIGSSPIFNGVVDAPLAETLLTGELSEMAGGTGGIKRGVKGISCLGSRISGNDDFLIKCSYKLSVPFAIPARFSLDMDQSLRYRYFTGYRPQSLLSEAGEESSDEAAQEEDELVYITETGTVYHKTLDCSALRIKVSECAFDDVARKRNIAGCKYYPCEYCAHGSKPGTVYITEDGRRYHYNSDCGEIKRTITQVKKSEVPGRRGCKRCCKDEQ